MKKNLFFVSSLIATIIAHYYYAVASHRTSVNGISELIGEFLGGFSVVMLVAWYLSGRKTTLNSWSWGFLLTAVMATARAFH
jgi:hypothetical protein